MWSSAWQASQLLLPAPADAPSTLPGSASALLHAAYTLTSFVICNTRRLCITYSLARCCAFAQNIDSYLRFCLAGEGWAFSICLKLLYQAHRSG